jgi:glycerol uptake facilitator-like aquaporin
MISTVYRRERHLFTCRIHTERPFSRRVLRVIAAEMICTSCLVNVMLPSFSPSPSRPRLQHVFIFEHRLLVRGKKDNHFCGFAIGVTVLMGSMAVGSVSGCAFIPAVRIRLQLV